MSTMRVGPPTAAERAELLARLASTWGPTIVSRGRLHRMSHLPSLVACDRGDLLGGLLYRHGDDGTVEVVVLQAFVPRRGIGSSLLQACTARFGNVWLVTTNDNVDAQRFFLAAGGRRVAVHAGAVTLARRLKPGIPTTGHGGVPITDEIEFAWAAQPPGTC